MFRYFGALLALIMALPCAATEQTISGVTLPSGTTALAPGAVAAIQANFNDVYAQLATLNGGIGTGGGLTNQYDMCTQSGVDKTGFSDSLGTVTTSFSTVPATGKPIYINCPIRLHFGSSGTAQIYIKSFTNVVFGPFGAFIVDDVGVNAFVMANITDGLWACGNIDGCVQYQATPGALIAGCGLNCGVYAPGVAAEYASLKTYLAANGVTFGSGGNPAWQGQSPFLPIFNIRGNTKRITFRNMTLRVPQGANPANFMPAVFGMYYEYDPAKLTALATTANTTNAALNYTSMSFPTDIEFDHTTIDGAMMGWQGSCDCRWYNTVGERYTDMQDGTGNGSATATLTFSSLGTSSAQLLTNWTLPTGIYAFTTSVPQTICATFTNGSNAVNTFLNCTTGATTTVTGSPSLTVTTGSMGSLGNWFAPPHLFYVFDQLVAGTPQRTEMHDTWDIGPFVTNITTERQQGSGTTLSYKGELSNNSLIDGYVSLREGGFFDDEPCTSTCGGVMRNVFAIYNSQTPTANSGTVWGWHFLGPMNSQVYENITIVDSAAEPQNNPVPQGFGWSGDYDLVFSNIRFFMNDYPLGATFNPGFAFGSCMHCRFRGEDHFDNFSSAQTFRSPVTILGTNVVQDSDIDVSVYGWRMYPVVFNTSPAVNDTTEVLAANWAYSSGSCKFFLSDGSIRYATISNGSTTLGTFTNGLGVNTPISAAATANATCGEALLNNYTGYNARIIMGRQGLGTGDHIHVSDVDNNWEAFSDGNITREIVRLERVGTPGATTNVNCPNYFAYTAWSWQVNTALTGTSLTGPMSIGFSGATSALTGNGTITTSNSQFPFMAPYASPGTPVLLSPATGSVTGGSAQLSVECTTMVTTH